MKETRSVVKCNNLKRDLKRPQLWLYVRLMKFSPAKCEVMKFGNKDMRTGNYYENAGDKLQESMCERDFWD